MGGRARLREALARALSTDPYSFAAEAEDEAVLDKIIADAELWGLVVKVKLRRGGDGYFVVYTVDLSKVEKLCAYEECSKIEEPPALESCIARCVSTKLPAIIRERLGGVG